MGKNQDDTEDFDLEDKDEDLEDDEEEEESDDSDDDSEEDDDDEDEDDDESDEEEIEDDKPINGKQFKSLQKSILGQLAVLKRHSIKNSKISKDKPKPKEKDRDVVADRLSQLEISDRKRQFGYENNLSPKETDLVFQFSKNPSHKTLKHPFVAGGLEKLRSKKSADDNTPSGSQRRPFKVNGKNWNDLSPEERQANFKERQKAILAGKNK